MPSRKARSGKRWSMYPSFHDAVSQLLKENDLYFGFYETDDPRGCIQEYDTNIMGRFVCRNSNCGQKGWSSKMIAITIRLYYEDRYNARVYHQRCMTCNNLSQPILNESYAERVSYRIKKWNGIQMERPYYSGTSKGPHNTNLCEGCKDGHCSALGSHRVKPTI
ncbi:zinc-binding domain-containing protein [Talaromyces proteolyticus]|uniref:Zinc-binding domain-containing protein n=1 Tax=Talaromyces proteolyticus TaxID=1131652 RepID=A0AAD4KL70_9EURO|nr:zinc-binding domain-containing protein [Talaromyces proteolyticus]KAH8693696.1 zinc-binding domain-containing protein [Talaromyces proteolyticus]